MPRTIKAGETINLGTITLTPIPTVGIFYGTITNSDAVGKYVVIDSYRSSQPIATNGYFEVVVPPGTYYTLNVEGFQPYNL